MRRTRPEEGVVGVARFVGDRRDIEHRVDSRGRRRIRRAGVIDDALQFLRVGQAPVVVSGQGEIFAVGQRRFPVHALAAVALLPHQAGRVIGHRAVAVGGVIVVAVAAGVADINRIVAARRDAGPITLDAAIGEVDAEEAFLPVHHVGHVDTAGRPLRIDNPRCVGIPVSESECGVVDERRDAGRVITALTARVFARELNQRVKFFDRR